MSLDFEEILVGNLTIAKFMGYQILNKKYQTQTWGSSNESCWTWTEGDIVCDEKGVEVDDENNEPYTMLESLPFNLYWDWIIPVLKRISSLYSKSDSFQVLINITNKDFKITAPGFKYLNFNTNENWTPFDVETIWSGVVEFINWHNTVNKINLKGNFWIEGIIHDNIVRLLPTGVNTIYQGKINEIPEDIVSEIVKNEVDLKTNYKLWRNYRAGLNNLPTYIDSFKSACNTEYCIIYETNK